MHTNFKNLKDFVDKELLKHIYIFLGEYIAKYP